MITIQVHSKTWRKWNRWICSTEMVILTTRLRTHRAEKRCSYRDQPVQILEIEETATAEVPWLRMRKISWHLKLDKHHWKWKKWKLHGSNRILLGRNIWNQFTTEISERNIRSICNRKSTHNFSEMKLVKLYTLKSILLLKVTESWLIQFLRML